MTVPFYSGPPVADLNRGDRVRVHFSDGVEATGTLWGASQLLDPADATLRLDSPKCYRIIRYHNGAPGPGITSIERWDDDTRFDRCMEAAKDWAQLQDEAEHAPKSEQGWRRLKADEAKHAFLDEWMRSES